MKILMLDCETYGRDIPIEKFETLGTVVKYGTSTRQEALERVRQHNPDIVITNKVVMDEELFRAGANIKMVAVTATGYNTIDIDYAAKHGIRVANVAGYSTDSVVQHTFALALCLLEKISYYDSYVKSGEYAKCPIFSHFSNAFHELSGMTWGIAGLGNIGRSVARVAEVFGCRVIYYSASGNAQDVPYERRELDEFLKESDIISIHAPLNDKTENLFNYETLSKMKKSAILLNLGRGSIVNDADLARGLQENLIAGAGLDVLSREPIQRDNPLLAIKDSTKLIVTPHMAWATVEARTRLMDEVFENIKSFMEGGKRNMIV